MEDRATRETNYTTQHERRKDTVAAQHEQRKAMEAEYRSEERRWFVGMRALAVN